MGVYENARLETKNRIKSAFWEAYKSMPISKITVRYLSETCQIHRSTFYFHYQDIYAILEEIEEDLLKKLSIFEKETSEKEFNIEYYGQLFYQVFSEDRDYLTYLVHQRKDYDFSVTYIKTLREKLIQIIASSEMTAISTQDTYLIDLTFNGIILTLVQGITEQTLSQDDLHKLISGLTFKGVQNTLKEDFNISL